MKNSAHYLTTLRDWRLLIPLVLGSQLLWFAWLYPLIPVGIVGWLVVASAGLGVMLWSALSVYTMLWLAERRRFVVICKVIAVLVALSLGIGIFATAYWQREFLGANTRYFGR